MPDLDERPGPRWRFELRAPLTLLLIAINVAVFVAQNVVNHAEPGAVYRNFALSAYGLSHGWAWQLLTFQFLHLPLESGGIFHLLGNLFIIHVFGRPVEIALGRARFLGLYLLGGTTGGLLQIAAGVLAPTQFGLAVAGASAGAFALLTAYATLYPKRPLHFFFLPLPMRADVLFSVLVAVTLAGLFLPSGHAAHCAHLGGMLTGFVLARQTIARNRAPALNIVSTRGPFGANPTGD